MKCYNNMSRRKFRIRELLQEGKKGVVIIQCKHVQRIVRNGKHFSQEEREEILLVSLTKRMGSRRGWVTCYYKTEEMDIRKSKELLLQE